MRHAISEATEPLEIYLKPGEFHFGGNHARVHTLLGSCVSITLWHPLRRIGGMCHFMLPSRGKAAALHPDGRYADESVKLFLREIGKFKSSPGEYQVKLFGGGSMFQQFRAGKPSEIAYSNIEAARTQLKAGGFSVHAEDVGGNGHRRIILDLRDGNVWVKREKISVPRPVVVKPGIANRFTAGAAE